MDEAASPEQDPRHEPRTDTDPETGTTPAEPMWWPQFEHAFEAYVRLAAQREQNGDSGRAS